MGIAGYRQEEPMDIEVNISENEILNEVLTSCERVYKFSQMEKADKTQLVLRLGEMVDISTYYNMKYNAKGKKEELKKRAADLFNKAINREGYSDLFGFVCPVSLTEKDFVEGVLYQWDKLRDSFTVSPLPRTLDYLREETKEKTDQEIINFFDFSEYENTLKVKLEVAGLKLAMAIYQARPTDLLKEGINSLILRKNNLTEEGEEWEKANQAAIDVTWELADPNIDVLKYILERSGCRNPEEDETQTISVRYPKSLSWPYGRVNMLISSNGYAPFMYNDVEISKSRGSEETDSVVQFRFAGEGDHIRDNPFETQKAAICNIEKLNEKYADLMAPRKSKFTESVISAIGAYMLEADPSMRDKNQLLRYGRETIKYPVALTPAMIYKWMMADKDVYPTPEIEADIRRAVGFCNAIWVKMDSIRGSKGKVSITERYLNFSYVEVTANGKTVSGWKFSQVPASVRYNVINGDITKLEMKEKKENELPGTDTKKKRRNVNGYNNFLEAWIKRYDGKGRETLEYGFRKIINEVYDPDIDLDLSENRLVKFRESKKIEKAAEDLKKRGQIRGYEVQIEKKGNQEEKKLIIHLLKKPEKQGEKGSKK